jgi:Hydrolytic ATP binding site of dynein motor region
MPQLSAQKHYDWGLRNILAVLRTAGQTKRDNIDKPEAFLMYRCVLFLLLYTSIAMHHILRYSSCAACNSGCSMASQLHVRCICCHGLYHITHTFCTSEINTQ